jgi:hypothetical protein
VEVPGLFSLACFRLVSAFLRSPLLAQHVVVDMSVGGLFILLCFFLYALYTRSHWLAITPFGISISVAVCVFIGYRVYKRLNKPPEQHVPGVLVDALKAHRMSKKSSELSRPGPGGIGSLPQLPITRKALSPNTSTAFSSALDL